MIINTYTYYFIYKVVNLINKKCYVGFHATNNEYDDYFGSGKLICKAIKKYGIQNFIKGVIEYVSIQEWREKEKYWIKEMKTHVSEGGYNLTYGGNGTLGYKDSEKTKKQKSKSLSGENNGMYGKSLYNLWVEKYEQKLADEKVLDLSIKRKQIPIWNKNKKCKQLSGQNNGNFNGYWHGINPAINQKGKTLEEIYGGEKAEIIKKKRKLSRSKKIICPFCSKSIETPNYKRWHGENCKSKILNLYGNL